MPTKQTLPQTDLNLYEKLAIIGKSVKVIKKSKQGYGYTYVPDEDILACIQGKMEELGVALEPRIVPGTTVITPRDTKKTKVAKDGKTTYDECTNELLINGEIVYSWVNIKNPEERIDIPWAFIGHQTNASQAFGSALTYAARYFKLQYFNSATGDNTDAILKKKKEAEEAENKEVLDMIFAKLDTAIADILKAQPDMKSKVVEICTEYSKLDNKKGAAYKEIRTPKIAADLLEAITSLNN